MASITLKGTPINTSGDLPATGSPAPDFTLVGQDLGEVTLKGLGTAAILNIVPSLDTGVCLLSAKRFQQELANLEAATILTVSKDLPFAQARVCGSEDIATHPTASAFRSSFGADYGIDIVDGPLEGVLARGIVVVDSAGIVRYSELVPEITQEPDYDAALSALRAL